eukprot:CAMPEP_0202898958 /NCGR_PEP_ID=MMETSP1392-20130828/7333_1 /ASSEMBLY_ACC=CAM_ASM_000868 /TAXON_ID=225041 /ORGANISM="Chlamydomonas chlamydogama, Strain SAG 11-48b" /LENGTH=629 /DNA_ID=CAMNT_0049585031 /DNA_START=305 /DNA_END=2193 /DNA_ORIENTATION=+
MGQAHCQQQQQPAPATSTSEADKLLRLKEWLVKQGANVDLVDIRASTAGPDAGLGLFVSDKADTRKLGACSQGIRRWWWPFGGRQPSPSQRAGALAEFPLSMAVSSSNILRDPAQGAGYSWMLKHGVVDERTIVMAYLVLERLKGQASAIAPWIDALPASFHTPLHMSADELDELKGTTLYWVASKLRERLADQWEKLGPALNSLAAGAAGVSRQASLQDLQWAFSVFWSRGQSLPVPREGAASHLFAKDPKAAAQQLEVTEGILPGLDFANHQVLHPQCWWEVVVQPAASQQKQGGPPATTAALDPERVLVQLRLHAGARASRGEELFISYGDKSNEELMLLYGFAVPRNPHDLVMVKLPIPPPATWDDVMNARMELMQAEGLKPQFFLKASDLPPEAGSRQQAAAQRTAGGVATRRSVVPEEALAVLTLTVLNFSELAQRMRVLKQRQKGEAGEDTGGTVPGLDVVAMDMAELRRLKASLSTRQLSEQGHSLGLHMAALSTLVKLLEATVYELEGEEGSGPLEEDEALLERHFRQQTAGGSGPDALSPARLAMHHLQVGAEADQPAVSGAGARGAGGGAVHHHGGGGGAEGEEQGSSQPGSSSQQVRARGENKKSGATYVAAAAIRL